MKSTVLMNFTYNLWHWQPFHFIPLAAFTKIPLITKEISHSQSSFDHWSWKRFQLFTLTRRRLWQVSLEKLHKTEIPRHVRCINGRIIEITDIAQHYNYKWHYIKTGHNTKYCLNCNPVNLQPSTEETHGMQHNWKWIAFVPKIFVCLSQSFSENAIIVKLTVAPPSNCIVTTYTDKLQHANTQCHTNR